MKGILLLAGLLGATSIHGQLAITRFDHNGILNWTNRFFHIRPVYEILAGSSLTGHWEHVAFVTNQTSFAIPNPPASGEAARFFRLEWFSDEPLELNYTFEQDAFPQEPGCPTITGRLNISPVVASPLGLAGTWRLDPAACYVEGPHPTGTGLLAVKRIQTNRAELYLIWNVFDGKSWLDGTLEQVFDEQGGLITRYSGMVYQETIAGAGPIGTFIAQKVN